MEMELTDDIGDTDIFLHNEIKRVLMVGLDMGAKSLYTCECGNIVLYPEKIDDVYMCRRCADKKRFGEL